MRGVVWAVAAFVLVLVLVALSFLVLWRTSPTPQNASGWSQLADLPNRRGEMAGVVTASLFGDGEEDEFVVIGGLTGIARTSSAVRVYDPAADAWRARQSLPVARHHTAAAALEDGTLMVAGGAEGARDWVAQSDVWLQDGEGWREGPALPEPRLGHQMVTLDGLVYVVGGEGRSAQTLIFEDGSWRTGAALPEPRDHLGLVVVDDEIWAIGGRNGDITDRVDIYDPEADAWRAGPALPAPTSGAAVAVVDDTPVVVGGEDPSVPGGTVIEAAWYYDGRSWESLPDPPLAVHGAAVGVLDGQMLIAGGASRHGAWSVLAWTDAVQALDPAALR